MKAGSKDLRALQRELKPGYWIEADGKSKCRVMGPEGVLRYGDGRPVGMPNTPRGSEIRGIRARLVDAGAIEARAGGKGKAA